MGYGQQYELVKSEDFKGRVAMSLVGTASYTKNEDAGVPDHEQRILYAKSILNDPMSFVKDYIYLVASNPVIAAAGPVFSADSDIEYVIAVNFAAKALEYAPGM